MQLALNRAKTKAGVKTAFDVTIDKANNFKSSI